MNTSTRPFVVGIVCLTFILAAQAFAKPTASFSTEPGIPTGSYPLFVQFRDTSTFDSGESIVSWFWQFGDGKTSIEQHPKHIYGAGGSFTPQLTITTQVGVDTKIAAAPIVVDNLSPLNAYIQKPDASYGYRVLDGVLTSPNYKCKAHVIELTSQTWRSLGDFAVPEGLSTQQMADYAKWKHWMTVIEPTDAKNVNQTAFLFITGGSRYRNAPTEIDENLARVCEESNAILIELQDVPNEPLIFADEPGKQRSEDEIIAYTFDKYMATGDSSWPLLMPMVKSAVKAMDATQNYFTQRGINIRNFMVGGASKRGWTTWLTGAADVRVKAIAPIVIDVLNMGRQMAHHRASYGYWAPSIYPYAQMTVFDRLNTPEGRALGSVVDPYSYRDNLMMPKYITASTGDQFFLPDASQFYFNDLGGIKYVHYVANSDHGLMNTDETTDEAVLGILGFFQTQLKGTTPPTVTWTYEDNNMRIQTSAPAMAELYVAETPGPLRDFRLEAIGPAWQKTLLTPSDSSIYNPLAGTQFLATAHEPAEGWRAYYVVLKFADFICSTPVRVLPDRYPNLESYRTEISNGEDSFPVAVLRGTSYDMGKDLGSLMKTEIQAFIPEFLSKVKSKDPDTFSDQSLDNAWDQTTANGKTDQRFIDEISGLSEGSDVSVTSLRRANMVPVLAALNCSAATVWGYGTDNDHNYQLRTLNWDLDLTAQSYPCVSIYLPDSGMPHIVPTFAGLIGAQAGMNLAGLSLAQSGKVTAGVIPNGQNGTQFTSLFRTALYDYSSMNQVLDLMRNTDLVKDYYYLVNDGRYFNNGRKIRAWASQAPPNDLLVWEDNDPQDEVNPSIRKQFLFNAENQNAVRTDLTTNYPDNETGGLYNAEKLKLLANTLTVSRSNLMNVVFDTTDTSMWVSYAKARTDARFRPYAKIRLGDFVAESSYVPPVEGEPLEGQIEGQLEGGPVEGQIEGQVEGQIEGQPAEGQIEGQAEGEPAEGQAEGQIEGQTEGQPAEGQPVEGQAEGQIEGQPAEGQVEGQLEGETLEGETPPLFTFGITARVRGAGTVAGVPTAAIVPGASVTLTAQPTVGWGFVRWEGDLSSETPQASLIVNSDKTVTAVFTQLSAPEITSLYPEFGSTSGGNAVALHGLRFAGIQGVKFGDIPASKFRVVSETLIWVEAPAQAAGTVEVSLQSAKPETTPVGYTYADIGSAIVHITDAVTLSPLDNAVAVLTPGPYVSARSIAGLYTFSGIPVGAYELDVSAYGYAPLTLSINVTAVGATTEVAMTAVRGTSDSDGDGLTDTIESDVFVSHIDLPDSDEDGMSDLSEAQNQFQLEDAADATMDADGDQIINVEEVFAGSNPNDITSPLPTVFVATNGSDDAAGTLTAPWKSLGYALAASTFPTSIVMMPGTYDIGNVVLPEGYTLRGSLYGKAILVGSVEMRAGTGLVNLEITEPATTPDQNALVTFSAAGALMDKVTLTGMPGSTVRGLYVPDTHDAASLVTRCTFTALGAGVEVYGNVPRIRLSRFFKIYGNGITLTGASAKTEEDMSALGKLDNPNSGYNTFNDFGSGRYSIRNQRTLSVLAENNDWGNNGGSYATSGKVDVVPSLVEGDGVKAGSMYGVLWNVNTRKPVGSVDIQAALEASGKTVATTSEANGVFEMACMKDGLYLLDTSRTGFDPSSANPTIPVATTVYLVLPLFPVPALEGETVEGDVEGAAEGQSEGQAVEGAPAEGSKPEGQTEGENEGDTDLFDTEGEGNGLDTNNTGCFLFGGSIGTGSSGDGTSGTVPITIFALSTLAMALAGGIRKATARVKTR